MKSLSPIFSYFKKKIPLKNFEKDVMDYFFKIFALYALVFCFFVGFLIARFNMGIFKLMLMTEVIMSISIYFIYFKFTRGHVYVAEGEVINIKRDTKKTTVYFTDKETESTFSFVPKKKIIDVGDNVRVYFTLETLIEESEELRHINNYIILTLLPPNPDTVYPSTAGGIMAEETFEKKRKKNHNF